MRSAWVYLLVYYLDLYTSLSVLWSWTSAVSVLISLKRCSSLCTVKVSEAQPVPHWPLFLFVAVLWSSKKQLFSVPVCWHMPREFQVNFQRKNRKSKQSQIFALSLWTFHNSNNFRKERSSGPLCGWGQCSGRQWDFLSRKDRIDLDTSSHLHRGPMRQPREVISVLCSRPFV